MYDIKDDIVYFDRNREVFFFLYKKEFNRLRPNERSNCAELPMSLFSKDASDYIYTTYEFWNNNALIVNMEKDSTDDGLCKEGYFSAYKPIRRYYTKKNKSRSLTLYYINKTTPNILEHNFSGNNKELIDHILSNGILKSYNISKDAYIFQVNDSLYWLIGSDITPSIEIIYHIYTDKTNLLPEGREKYRFDNQGFRLGSNYQFGKADNYVIFKREIPSAYPITHVNVGFNSKEEGLIWFKPFSISPYKN